MQTVQRACCGNCGFWFAVDGPLGECQLRPPVVVPGEQLGLQPTTRCDDACGEWSPSSVLNRDLRIDLPRICDVAGCLKPSLPREILVQGHAVKVSLCHHHYNTIDVPDALAANLRQCLVKGCNANALGTGLFTLGGLEFRGSICRGHIEHLGAILSGSFGPRGMSGAKEKPPEKMTKRRSKKKANHETQAQPDPICPGDIGPQAPDAQAGASEHDAANPKG